MNDFIYHNPVKMFFGETHTEAVISQIKQYGSKVLPILGGESFVRNGNYARLTRAMDQAGVERHELSGNRAPLLSTVRDGIELCRSQHIDCVLGIGGGCCMDIAKTIAFGAKQPADIWDYLTGQVQPETGDHLPVGTIPTFPSSGSDMNGSTQITHDETGEQAGLSGVFPNFAWLNPSYVASLPLSSFIEGQLTAFVQVSIAYLGLERSHVAERMALSLMDLLREGLRRLMAEPASPRARADLMLASALNVNGLTSLGKSGDWSLYPLQTIAQRACGVGYKHAITVLFPYWLKQCFSGQQVFKDYFEQAFGIDPTGKGDEQVLEEGLRALFDLYREFGFPTSFSQVAKQGERTDAPQTAMPDGGTVQAAGPLDADALRTEGQAAALDADIPRAVTPEADAQQMAGPGADELRAAVLSIGDVPSMYTTFTAEKTVTMLREAIDGM